MAVVSSALLVMGGCASVANKDDLYLLKTETNEEISSLKLNAQRLQEQVQELRKQVDFVKTDTNNQVINLSADVSSRITAIETARTKDKEEISKKFNVVIDEVSGPKTSSNRRPVGTTATPFVPADAITYVVRTGDTISKIARHFSITPQELMSANNLQDPNQIGIGSNLIIPKAGESAPTTASSKAEVPAASAE